MPEFATDALVTLGGGTNRHGVILPRSLARIDEAVHQYHNGEAPCIILVGGYWLMTDDSSKSGTSEVQQMEDRALALGVPSVNAIKAALKSRETIGNALFAKQEILEPNNWKNIDVVTSITHLPRSLVTFKHILGPEYQVNGIEAPEKWVLPKKAYEVLGLMMQRYVLDGTKPGDNEAIHARLLERVPGYDNDVTPKELALKSLLHVVKSDEPAFYTLAQAA
ncbi:MAG: hypothetical protein JWL89_156 [Candidatus Saccharibacteria bacterium]|nr:hypothetical protein [Candidatus Saccharibacteria bacterium]